MQDQSDSLPKAVLLISIGAIIGWFTLILQFVLALSNRTVSVPETIIRYFSYFTILSNTLAAICFTALLFTRRNGKAGFFSQPQTLAATAVYMAVVALVYNVLLRFLWTPEGWQLLADESLHVVLPGLYIIYWFLYVPKNSIQWKNMYGWLLYPAVYSIYTLAHGSLSGFYPYPFTNVNVLGYPKVFVNFAGVLALFLALSVVVVSVARKSVKNN